MARRGNLPALKKAIRANHAMPQSAKKKAFATIEKKIAKSRPRYHRSNPRPPNLGVEGLKEAGVAAVKLASHPIDQLVEGYHLANGLRKFWMWLEHFLGR